MISVNTHLLCSHSDYFKSLFNGSFSERHQTIIPIVLPETISVESFIHLINLITNPNEIIQLDLIPDLFRLCDKYLFDYLPYLLVKYVIEQFQNGLTTDIVDIVSKPNLISCLIRACFSHLLISKKNISLEIFSTVLMKIIGDRKGIIRIFDFILIVFIFNFFPNLLETNKDIRRKEFYLIYG